MQVKFNFSALRQYERQRFDDYLVNNMVVDDFAARRGRAETAMILNLSHRNIPD